MLFQSVNPFRIMGYIQYAVISAISFSFELNVSPPTIFSYWRIDAKDVAMEITLNPSIFQQQQAMNWCVLLMSCALVIVETRVLWISLQSLEQVTWSHFRSNAHDRGIQNVDSLFTFKFPIKTSTLLVEILTAVAISKDFPNSSPNGASRTFTLLVLYSH